MVTKQSLFLKTFAWKIIQRTELNNYNIKDRQHLF